MYDPRFYGNLFLCYLATSSQSLMLFECSNSPKHNYNCSNSKVNFFKMTSYRSTGTRITNKFWKYLENTFAQTYEIMKYGKCTSFVSRTQIFNWHQQLNDGRESFEDVPRFELRTPKRHSQIRTSLNGQMFGSLVEQKSNAQSNILAIPIRWWRNVFEKGVVCHLKCIGCQDGYEI